MYCCLYACAIILRRLFQNPQISQFSSFWSVNIIFHSPFYKTSRFDHFPHFWSRHIAYTIILSRFFQNPQISQFSSFLVSEHGEYHLSFALLQNQQICSFSTFWSCTLYHNRYMIHLLYMYLFKSTLSNSSDFTIFLTFGQWISFVIHPLTKPADLIIFLIFVHVI